MKARNTLAAATVARKAALPRILAPVAPSALARRCTKVPIRLSTPTLHSLKIICGQRWLQ